MRLTSEMLRQLVESELAKAKEVSAGDMGKQLANKVDHYKDVSGNGSKKPKKKVPAVKKKVSPKNEGKLSPLDYVRALELEEKRLHKRLAQISEQRTRIIEGISESN